jgi:hypothetical protein
MISDAMGGDQPSSARRCGRPTRSGKPCQAFVYGFDVACARHATDHDRELTETYGRGHHDGYRQGHESGAAGAKSRIEWLERRVQELEGRLDDAMRVYEIGGDQVVEVGRYSYRWRGPTPLQVGDRVLLPENWLTRMKDGPGPHVGVVTALGSTYHGELSFIVGRAPTNSSP